MTQSDSGDAKPALAAPPQPAPHDVLVITSSPSITSRSEKLGELIVNEVGKLGHDCRHLKLRTLCAEALLGANTSHPDIVKAMDLLARSHGLVVITPTYKGSYSGLFKTFVDLLPQYALRSKVVLPLATGGSPAHMLMLDHGLRPVLQTMWPKHVNQGCFIVDSLLASEDGFDLSSSPLLSEVFAQFMDTLQTI